MISKIILEEELNTEELQKLEILFKETPRDILDDFLILTDSPELARICRRFDMAVAAVLSGVRRSTAARDAGTCGERDFPGIHDTCGEEDFLGIHDTCEEGDFLGIHDICEEGDFSGIPYAVTDIDDLDERYLERIWQRYRGLPWEICETERCFVRETVPEDVDSFYRIYSDKSITAYMEDLFENRDEEKQYIRDYIEKVYGFYGFGMWTVCLKETGEVIGRAGLSMREGFEEPELGYVIGTKWQRQGIAAEVCREVLRYGRDELGFERVRALVHPGNTASERLCRKLGFQYKKEITLDSEIYNLYEKEL